MTQQQIAITAEPTSEATCRFTIDRPIYPDRSFFFGSKEQAEGSPLAERLFQIEGVTSVLISHSQVTVTKAGFEPWQIVGKQIGAALREHIADGQPAVADVLRESIPPAEEIREKVQQVLDTEINPGVAAHGGFIRLIDVKENVVYIQMGGGCQGCGMADVTLKQGVEKTIRQAIPQIGAIMDTTDHASGRNPYYAPSK